MTGNKGLRSSESRRRVVGCCLTFRSKVSAYCPAFQQSKLKIGQMRCSESRDTITNERTNERTDGRTEPTDENSEASHSCPTPVVSTVWLVCSSNIKKPGACPNKMNTVCFTCTLCSEQRQKTVVLTRKQPQLFHVRSLSHAYNWAYQSCAYCRGKTDLRYYTVLTPPPHRLPHQPVITLVAHDGLSWNFNEWWPRELLGWRDTWRFEMCKKTHLTSGFVDTTVRHKNTDSTKLPDCCCCW